jgi:hypothetical protein
MNEPKLGPTELRAEIVRLHRAAEMPTLEQVLSAVAEARILYADKIRAARAEGPDDLEDSE